MSQKLSKKSSLDIVSIIFAVLEISQNIEKHYDIQSLEFLRDTPLYIPKNFPKNNTYRKAFRKSYTKNSYDAFLNFHKPHFFGKSQQFFPSNIFTMIVTGSGDYVGCRLLDIGANQNTRFLVVLTQN